MMVLSRRDHWTRESGGVAGRAGQGGPVVSSGRYYTRQLSQGCRYQTRSSITKQRSAAGPVGRLRRAGRTAGQRSVNTMGATVSRGMKQLKSDGNGNYSDVGSNNSPTTPTRPLPVRLEMTLDQPALAGTEQESHAWNPDDRSLNIFVKESDPFTFHRHPVAQSTDSIRGRRGYKSGLHVFSVEWPSRQHGTHAVVGVATREAPLHSAGYHSLVGSNSQSWGWDLGRCKAYHDSDRRPGLPYPAHSTTTVPDSFLMVLDCEAGSLAFVSRGEYLGVAHSGLPTTTNLYPVVSSVWGHCEVGLRYLGGLEPGPPSLASWCRRTIRKSVGPARIDKGDMDRLVLPTAIKQFLVYK